VGRYQALLQSIECNRVGNVLNAAQALRVRRNGALVEILADRIAGTTTAQALTCTRVLFPDAKVSLSPGPRHGDDDEHDRPKH
jgi:hypothetical protein